MAGQTAEAIGQPEQAVAVLERDRPHRGSRTRRSYLGAVQVLTDRQEEALPRLLSAQALAQRAGRLDPALCNNYIGCVRVDLGDVSTGLGDLRRACTRRSPAAPRIPSACLHEPGRDDLPAATLRRAAVVDRGRRVVRDHHDLPGHLRNLEAHLALMLIGNGAWDDAQSRLQCLVDEVRRAGPANRCPAPARPPAGPPRRSRGDRHPPAGLGASGRQRSLAALAPAGLAGDRGRLAGG